MFEWYSLRPKTQNPPYPQALPKMFAAVSTPLPCGPPAIQFVLSITILFFTTETILGEERTFLLSACYFVVAYAAVAPCTLAAVRAHTPAVVDEVSAIV